MSKLREKLTMYALATELDKSRSGEVNAIILEQITKDFTIKFFDWANVNAYKYPTSITTEELLQIFKDKYYGK